MSHPFTDFYRGKRVLVTGHTGFEGGWTAAWLKLLGAQVCGYGLPPATRPNFFDATILDRGMTSVFGDIRDRNSLASTFTEVQPEIVIHCASRTSPQAAFHEPVDAFSTNVLGTVNILEEARLTQSVKSMVLVSTASCDAHELSPSANAESQEIYRSSLASAELARLAFNKTYFQTSGAAIATARVADAIGGGDWRAGRVVPDLVRAIISAQLATDHQAKGRKLRIWHVLEPVRACLLLAKNLFERGQKSAGAWDFAPGGARIAASEFSEKFAALWNQDDIKAPDPLVPKSRPEKTEAELGWSPAMSADQALAVTVEWYRGYCLQPDSALKTTQDQIEQYMRASG